MTCQPFDWNVVVLGAWNVAILTPRGIAARLLSLGDTVPVEIQVVIDRPSPLRVVYRDLAVIASDSRLIVSSTSLNANGLGSASEVASRAVVSLPETPLTAAGVNIQYVFDQIPDSLLEIIGSGIDDKLTDADPDLRFLAKEVRRTVRWNGGTLNIQLRENEDASALAKINFHMESSDSKQIAAWLNQSADMLKTTKKLLSETLALPIEDCANVE